MRKFFYLAFVLCMGLAVTSCNDDEEERVDLVVQTEWQMSADQLTATEGVEFVLAPQYSGADKKTVWEWQLNDETIGEEPVLRYTFAEEGTYVVYLTAINKSGSGVGYSYTITVKPAHMLDFEGDYWSNLIDNAQYGGLLIYSPDEYKWKDESTTLSSECVKDDWTMWDMGWGWKNGIAISNYIDADVENHASYLYQLSVPKSNDSSNFAIVWDDGSAMTFADGEAHVIKRMQVMNTTYALGTIKKELGENYKFAVKVTGKNGDTETGSLEIVLAEGETAVEDWQDVDLSSLGEVTGIEFTFVATEASTPKYFAFDNVVVKMK